LNTRTDRIIGNRSDKGGRSDGNRKSDDAKTFLK
jgi:hypothetical protein